jgi:hypothetical protein
MFVVQRVTLEEFLRSPALAASACLIIVASGSNKISIAVMGFCAGWDFSSLPGPITLFSDMRFSCDNFQKKVQLTFSLGLPREDALPVVFHADHHPVALLCAGHKGIRKGAHC